MIDNPDKDFPNLIKGGIPITFGVYALIRIDKRVIYIGETGNFQERLTKHHEGIKFAHRKGYNYYISYSYDRSYRLEANRKHDEKILIKKYEPLYEIAEGKLIPTGKYPVE